MGWTEADAERVTARAEIVEPTCLIDRTGQRRWSETSNKTPPVQRRFNLAKVAIESRVRDAWILDLFR